MAWWAWADWSGYTKKKAVEKEIARKQARIDKSREALGISRSAVACYALLYATFKCLRLSGAIAGPSITVPSGLNRLPWQGQSQLVSTLFQCTLQPRCVQTGDTANSSPSGAR